MSKVLRDWTGSFLKRITTPFRKRTMVQGSAGIAAGDDPLNLSEEIRNHVEGILRAARESRQLFLEAARSLAAKIDNKDPYTRGHSERVKRISVEIARIMQLPDEEIENVEIGALMHDFGKITIDGRILNKPTQLTHAEFEIMKTHTTRGYDMLKHIPELKDVAPGLQSHHEQLDGNGYPHGLKGDEIPMIARIITVADCFDAMTTRRPYQEPAPIEHVLEVLRFSAGKRYDERVVEALIQGLHTGRIVPAARAGDR